MDENKKVIGKMKDECAKTFIRETCAIRSKVYATSCEDEEENKKKDKGIKYSCVKNEITYDDYKNCVFDNTTKKVDMNLIRSYNHVIYSESVNKLALCGINDKRYLIDSINSYAYGHYKIKKN